MTAVEHVHALWAAYETDGMPAILDQVHDECEWHGPPDLPGAADIRGPEAMRAYLERLRVDGVRFEPVLHSCEAVGDAVLGAGRLRVVTPTVLSDSPAFTVYHLRDERLARVDTYETRSQAVAAIAA